jgi:hypothetical protein
MSTTGPSLPQHDVRHDRREIESATDGAISDARSVDEDAPTVLARVGRWVTWPLVLGIVLGVLVTEVGLRVLELRHGDLDKLQLELFDKQADGLRAKPWHDVVVVGSSSAGAGVWMPDLERAGVACDGYVSWMAGPSMEAIALHTREVVLAGQPPRQVVVGMTMRAMNEASPTQRGQLELLRQWLGYTPPRQGGLAGVKDWAYDHIALLRSRLILQDPNGFGQRMLGRVGDPITEDGNSIQARGQLIEDESPRHRRQEASEVADYRLGQAQLEALAGLIENIERSGALPIVLNLPVSDRFIELAPQGRRDYEDYVAAVRNLTEELGVTLVDATVLELDQDRDFADVNHVNARGAERVSRLLAVHMLPCP